MAPQIADLPLEDLGADSQFLLGDFNVMASGGRMPVFQFFQRLLSACHFRMPLSCALRMKRGFPSRPSSSNNRSAAPKTCCAAKDEQSSRCAETNCAWQRARYSVVLYRFADPSQHSGGTCVQRSLPYR